MMKSYNLYCLLLLAIIFCGCKKKERETVVCSAVFIPQVLNFKIADKNSNADLFFGPQARYLITQLKVYQHNIEVPVEVVSYAVTGNYFKVETKVAFNNSMEKLHIKIADQPSVELSYSSQTTQEPCPRYLLNDVTINGTTYTNVKQQVITLKL